MGRSHIDILVFALRVLVMPKLTPLVLAMLVQFVGLRATIPQMAQQQDSVKAQFYTQLYLYPGVMIDSVTIYQSGDYWLVGLNSGRQSVYRAEEISRVFSDRVDVTHRYPELKNAAVPNYRYSYEMPTVASGWKLRPILITIGEGAFRGGLTGLTLGTILFLRLDIEKGFLGSEYVILSMRYGANIGAILALIQRAINHRSAILGGSETH